MNYKVYLWQGWSAYYLVYWCIYRGRRYQKWHF